ncbi:MAG TPA: hypothetical protein VKP00_09250 [Gemmatimonadaceae bacterium]|nr:hypothetical protein [Gemmatimonadaceae bacterium]
MTPIPGFAIVVPETSTVAVDTFVVSNAYRAVMVAVPTATAVAKPDGDTVATVDGDELHCTWVRRDGGALVVNWIVPPTINCTRLGEIKSGVTLLLTLPGGAAFPPIPATIGEVVCSQAASIAAATETTMR